MKIYIIDDDNISVYLTREIIKAVGFKGEVTSFSSAEEALDVLIKDIAAEIHQVIILDLDMPGMSGWGLLNALAPYKQQIMSMSRIYILTSSLSLSDKAKSEVEEMVSGLFHKPIEKSDVEAILS